MIDHVGFNVSERARPRRGSTRRRSASLGYSVAVEWEEHVGFGTGEGGPDFWISKRGEPTTTAHVALRAPDRAAVDEFHRAAVAAGGTDNGPPACGRTTTSTTTAPTSRIPTETTSKPSATTPRNLSTTGPRDRGESSGGRPMEFHQGRLFDHVHLRVRDLAASRRFYAAVLEALGRSLTHESQSAFAADELYVSEDGEPTSGLHIAFQAADREAVVRFHEAALAAGGVDNGRPGERDYHPGYYAAYVFDPDGNNVEAVHHGPATRSTDSVVVRPAA